jgi:hypothetical protein
MDNNPRLRVTSSEPPSSISCASARWADLGLEARRFSRGIDPNQLRSSGAAPIFQPGCTTVEVARAVTLARKTHPSAGDKRYGRSSVTNGSRLLHGIPQTSPWVRRCRDLINLHVADLGGEENTSVAERSIIRRASVLTTELEQLETKFATAGGAKPDDLDLYSRAASNLRRLLESVGLKRRAKDVAGLSLGDLLRQDQIDQRAAKAAAIDADEVAP